MATHASLPAKIGYHSWSYPSWKKKVYTAKSQRSDWLAQFSQAIPTVEGNASFHAIQSEDAFRRWGNEAAEGFEFCQKFPRAISHDRLLVDCSHELRQFLNGLAILADAGNLGPSFLQLPPNFSAESLPQLEAFLKSLPNEFPFAVEPRHPDFFDESENEQRFDDLLRDHQVDRCVFDTRALFSRPPEDDSELAAQNKKPRNPLRKTVTSSRPMVRLVIRNRLEQCEAWLDEWAEQLASWIEEDLRPILFLHVPDNALAPDMIWLFWEKVRARTNAMPARPRSPGELEQEQLRNRPQQLSLFG